MNSQKRNSSRNSSKFVYCVFSDATELKMSDSSSFVCALLQHFSHLNALPFLYTMHHRRCFAIVLFQIICIYKLKVFRLTQAEFLKLSRRQSNRNRTSQLNIRIPEIIDSWAGNSWFLEQMIFLISKSSHWKILLEDFTTSKFTDDVDSIIRIHFNCRCSKRE